MKKLLLAVVLLVLVIAAFYAFNSQPVHETLQLDLYEGWSQTTTNGVTFKYPPALATPYVSLTTWPPEVSRSTGYGCIEGNQNGFKNEEKTIRGTTYCVSMISEGAAGSTYVDYEYYSADYQMTFTIRFPQCLNYDEAEQESCLLDQTSLDLDTLADRILSSAR